MNVFTILLIIWGAISALNIVLSFALTFSALNEIKKEYGKVKFTESDTATKIIGIIRYSIFVLCPILHIWYLIPVLTHTEEIKDGIYDGLEDKLEEWEKKC